LPLNFQGILETTGTQRGVTIYLLNVSIIILHLRYLKDSHKIWHILLSNSHES